MHIKAKQFILSIGWRRPLMNVNGIELKFKIAYVSSGAGRNLKVGAHVRLKAPGKFFFVVQPPLFGSTCTISRSSERFRDGQYIWSVSCLTHDASVPCHL